MNYEIPASAAKGKKEVRWIITHRYTKAISSVSMDRLILTIISQCEVKHIYDLTDKNNNVSCEDLDITLSIVSQLVPSDLLQYQI